MLNNPAGKPCIKATMGAEYIVNEKRVSAVNGSALCVCVCVCVCQCASAVCHSAPCAQPVRVSKSLNTLQVDSNCRNPILRIDKEAVCTQDELNAYIYM